MHSDPLADALSRAELPDASAAVERTVAAAREAIAAAPARGRHPIVRRALAIAAAALLAAGFVTLTPPGRAAADWVGNLFGTAGPERHLLGAGTSPEGEPYEVRTEVGDLGEDQTCILFRWTEPSADAPDAFGSCDEGLRTQGPIDIPFIAETEEELLLIGALTNLQPSEVRLTHREAPGEPMVEAPVSWYTLDASSVENGSMDASHATFIVGFIPETVGELGGPTSAELVALGPEGEELARAPIEWVWGGFKGYRTSCGAPGPAEDACRATVDEDFRYDKLMRRLTAPIPPADLVERAAAAGIFLAPASREDALSLPVENDPLGTASKAMELAGDTKLEHGGGGDYETYLVRAGAESRLAIAVYLAIDKCGGGADAVCETEAPWDEELIVLVDAASGEEISLTRLEPAG